MFHFYAPEYIRKPQMVKQTIRPLLPTNCWSVFDQFLFF